MDTSIWSGDASSPLHMTTGRQTGWLLVLVLAVALSGIIAVAGAATPVASFTSNITSGTNPVSVQFIDTSTNTPIKWFWSFGDGATSTESDPAHTYTIDGTYTVTLTATNSGGSNSVTKANYITCLKSVAPPAASFVTTVSSGSKPLTVKFLDASTNSPTSWVWSFGDGGSSTEQSPSHVYLTSGKYTVTMTATNSGGSNTVTKEAYVTVTDEAAAPAASFVATTTSGTTPLTIRFVDTSTNGPTSWVWTFGDGYSDIVQNPTHTYSEEGSFTVTMTASNTAGSSTATKIDYITSILDEPIASFRADVTSGIAPLAVQFNDTSENAPTSWTWNFGDDTSSTEQNPLHKYFHAGTYSVIMTSRNSAGSNTTSKSEYINVSAIVTPEASFTAEPASGKIPLTVRFTDTSKNSPTSWQWTFGDGLNSAEQNPTHTYEDPGTYSVTLTVANAQGSATKTFQDAIVVTAPTTAPTEVPTTEAVTETPVPTETTAAPAAAAGDISSFPLVPVLIVIAAVVIIAILLLRARSSHGRHGSRRRDL